MIGLAFDDSFSIGSDFFRFDSAHVRRLISFFAVTGSLCIKLSSPGIEDAYGSDVLFPRILDKICNRGGCLDVLLSNGAFPYCFQRLRAKKIRDIYGSLLQSNVSDDSCRLVHNTNCIVPYFFSRSCES